MERPRWTEERDRTLAALLRAGLTMSQIGSTLHVTRNAVIGRVHRNKALQQIARNPTGKNITTTRPPPKKMAPRQVMPAKPKPRPPAAVAAPPPPTPMLTPVVVVPEKPMMAMVPLIERAGGTCRFPVEEDPNITGHFLFCGAARARNSHSYCAYHHAICLTGTVRRLH